jgi:hyperosmotically inducible periplasmic protein
MKRPRLLAALFYTSIALVAVLVIPAQAQEHQATAKGADRIVREVRHELVTLPYYSVFDNLAFRVEGYTVVLDGQVTRPTLKTDSERVVKKIEGVEKVVNNIEVLPLSGVDDGLRRTVYRAIYSQPGLDLYSLRAVPTIHIIVKNGQVTLKGAVGNQGDKQRAEIAAKGVPGAFSVTNDLIVSP